MLAHKSGWMQTEIFVQWFRHFLKHTHLTAGDPVLLILDGHSTHTKSIALIELARTNHVSIICLPAHTTHRLQPLDVSLMKPLNTYTDPTHRLQPLDVSVMKPLNIYTDPTHRLQPLDVSLMKPLNTYTDPTHRLQPLDVSLMKPLNTYTDHAIAFSR